MREKCRSVICGLIALSLCGVMILPSGQVVAAGDAVFPDRGDDHELEFDFEPVVPPRALEEMMVQVVALQMQRVRAPDGRMYLVLGAALQVAAGDGDFRCRAIVHQYEGAVSCAEVLDWPTE